MSYIKNTVFSIIVISGLLLSFIYTAQAANPGCKSECASCANMCEQTLNYCRKHGHNNAEHIKKLCKIV